MSYRPHPPSALKTHPLLVLFTLIKWQHDPDPGVDPTHRRSRGALVTGFLEGTQTPEEYIKVQYSRTAGLWRLLGGGIDV